MALWKDRGNKQEKWHNREGPWESRGYMGAEGCCQFPAVGGNLGRGRDIKGDSAGSWLMMSAQSSFLSLLRMPEHLHTCQFPKLDLKG